MNHYAARQARQMAEGARRRYLPPSEVATSTIRAILTNSPRAPLEERQLDMLDRGTGGPHGQTIYFAGNLDLTKQRCIAVIGARKASELGRKRARQLGKQLAESGIVVVSGLAEGVDTEALTGAMDAGGSVIAVIGTPLDHAYPAKNKGLQEEIYRSHLLVSQFDPGTRTFPSNFPARNRTMAALSDASVVIEASDTSGTLHQASECQRLGRWLAIAQSVVTDPTLSWPAKFIGQPNTTVLETTSQLLSTVYGDGPNS